MDTQYLSVFGLQSQLAPADGLDVSGLSQDLDSLRGLHQQRAGRRLQPGSIQRQQLTNGRYNVQGEGLK